MEVDVNPDYTWMIESWQNFLKVDVCEVSLGTGLKLEKLSLHIANNHWWPYIKFEVQGMTTNGWEVKQSVTQVAGGAAMHEVDLSQIADANEFKLIGNKAFCDYLVSVSTHGVIVDPYDQPIKECPLVIVNVHGACSHLFEGYDTEVHYDEAAGGSLSLGLEGHGQD